MAKLITLYHPDGRVEKHTLPNARDLLNVGWSYERSRPSSPVDNAPAAVLPTLAEKKELEKTPVAQEIFDRFGTRATSEQDADIPPAAETPDEVVTIDGADEEAPAEEGTDASAGQSDESAQAPRGRGRPRKTV